MDSSWYKRAVDQHSIEPDSFVFSVPFNAGTYPSSNHFYTCTSKNIFENCISNYHHLYFFFFPFNFKYFSRSGQSQSVSNRYSRGFYRNGTQSTSSCRRFTVSTFFTGLSLRQYYFDGKFLSNIFPFFYFFFIYSEINNNFHLSFSVAVRIARKIAPPTR